MIAKRPEVVQRFVDASIIGWYNYLYGDNRAANALIRKHNPEMPEDLLAYAVTAMKTHGIVDSGDTEKLGVGRDDRGADEKLLRQDGARRRGQSFRRLAAGV